MGLGSRPTFSDCATNVNYRLQPVVLFAASGSELLRRLYPARQTAVVGSGGRATPSHGTQTRIPP